MHTQAVQLVPALPTRLLPMLVQNMPHKLRDRSTQCLFLSAIISLCEGKVGPALREGLLAGVVEHLLSIDADIRWEDIVDAPTGGIWVFGGVRGWWCCGVGGGTVSSVRGPMHLLLAVSTYLHVIFESANCACAGSLSLTACWSCLPLHVCCETFMTTTA